MVNNQLVLLLLILVDVVGVAIIRIKSGRRALLLVRRIKIKYGYNDSHSNNKKSKLIIYHGM